MAKTVGFFGFPGRKASFFGNLREAWLRLTLSE
jgi:hypothetical protein